MKTNLLVLVTLIVALFVGLMSCSKKDDNLNVPAKKEQIRVYMSGLKNQSSLKLASTTEGFNIIKGVEIADGDTVNGAYQVNTLIWATNQSGASISGTWKVELLQSDYSDLKEPSYTYSSSFQQEYTGDQIAYLFREHGLYKVSFGIFIDYTRTDELFAYYVKIEGIPGKVGDGAENDYVFRMEKKTLFNLEKQNDEDLIFIYFKYSEKIDPEKKAVCIGYLHENGEDVWFDTPAIKWPFSKENYYYVVIHASRKADYYNVNFTTKSDLGFGWNIDANNHRSSFAKNGRGIYFSF